MKLDIKKLDVKKDARGWLAEIIHPEDVGDPNFGQIHITVVNPGKVRGNHYHKKRTEWFSVIKGKGTLFLKNMTNGEEKKIAMGLEDLSVIKIPPMYFHSFENTGQDEMYLLVYGDSKFDSNDPDTYTT